MSFPRALCLATALALLPAHHAAAQDESFARAASLQQAGELEKAAAEYRRFLEAYPANVEARSNLGVVLMGLGRYEDAITEYRLAASQAPTNVTVRLNLGLAFYKMAQLEAAVGEFAKVLSAQPDHRQARYLAADCRLRLGRPGDVISLLSPLETSDADNPVLAYLLGMAYLADKQNEKGQLLIDRILRHGDSAEARVMMGVAKRGTGDLKGAVDDLKRAVEINPELPSVKGLYGQALLEAGNPDLARPQFEAELSRNPLDFDANLYMGILLKAEQDYDGALGYLKRALGVRPGDLPTRFQIASIVLARQDTGAATSLLEGIVQEAPAFLEAHVALATAYYRQQRKADGDRERAVVERLTEEKDARARAQAVKRPPG
jgi:tetratricopeptide (TPR) repeat protein